MRESAERACPTPGAAAAPAALGHQTPPGHAGKCLLLQKTPALTHPARAPEPPRDRTHV